MLKIKDKRALIFFVVALIMLWQLGAVIKDLCTDVYAQMSTQNNPVFSFVYAQNTGGAFSLFTGHPYVLSFFGLAALLVVFVYVYKKISFDDKFKILASTFFAAGILGNVYERITLGHVVDYIKLNFVNFAVFNAFDVMISFSVVLFAAVIVLEELIIKYGKNNNK